MPRMTIEPPLSEPQTASEVSSRTVEGGFAAAPGTIEKVTSPEAVGDVAVTVTSPGDASPGPYSMMMLATPSMTRPPSSVIDRVLVVIGRNVPCLGEKSKSRLTLLTGSLFWSNAKARTST